MAPSLKIDFVSDVVCPWCVIGLLGLLGALEDLTGVVEAEIRLQPFELNPDLAPEGEAVSDHIRRKYGRSEAETRAVRETIRERAEALGFPMVQRPDARIYNTRKAHELLLWAEPTGLQLALKRALLAAYFQEGRDPSSPDVLAGAAAAAGLDAAAGLAAVQSGALTGEVVRREELWRRDGISGVPTVIIAERYALVGAQPRETYARALRSISAEAVAPTP